MLSVKVSVKERAARLLQKLPPAIQGQGGSSQAQSACFKLVQGLAMDPADAAAAFKVNYNPGCIPPFSDSEILRKCNDALKRTPREGRGFLLASNDPGEWRRPEAHPAPVQKPAKAKSKLYVRDERRPTREECFAIAKSRDLIGPGAMVAAAIGTLRVAKLFGFDVYGFGDANGPLVNVRRIDGELFPAYKGNDPIKSFTLVSGAAAFNRPYGYCDAPNASGVVLCEGVPDCLTAYEQFVWESSMAGTKLDDIEYVRSKLTCVPLMMLSCSSQIEPGSSYAGGFRGMSVLLVPHPDERGTAGAKQWFDAIKPAAESVSAFDCARVRGNPKDDFNSVFNAFTERVLPV